MEPIAKFEKVSLEQFTRDWVDKFPVSDSEKDIPLTEILDSIRGIYDNIELPRRGTKGSAAYDFFAPITIELDPGASVFFPTGIRVKIDMPYALVCLPRSGQGTKYKLRLANTIGLIDPDYYNADNEGHIMTKICNEGNEPLRIDLGKAFMQAMFLPFGIAEEEEVTDERKGGFGSTG